MAGKGGHCSCRGRNMTQKWCVVQRCRNCRSMWWSQFDRPSMGRPRKGFACHTCDNNRVHPLGKVSDASVYRCSACGTTYVDQVRLRDRIASKNWKRPGDDRIPKIAALVEALDRTMAPPHGAGPEAQVQFLYSYEWNDNLVHIGNPGLFRLAQP
jgi:hypothetical protein